MIRDELERIVDEAGALRAVGYFFDPDRPTEIAAVRLMFVDGDWLVSLNRSDATVELTQTSDDVFDRWRLANVSGLAPWADAIGRTALWTRLVEDQLGAPDAVQFEFVGVPGESSGESLLIQLMTTDIALVVQVVSTLPTPDLAARTRG
ncbi:hypothetical protein [Actinopolymorpha pittospori]|uniref:Uncharacterized protein n=1 Tax=Actinopolymorpha pittospori TaxID=648752 RepID=A0A927MZZ8_9ACTN|nr:hypothetical protein [Actinopolymorpha pittospori]MBE1606205.1 hypothetical protein [Actinopolymorpha pittospori]